ncbi:MAG: hypothetical protein NC393_12410 [Clostridium sp.]|nr:hypothetical protein [Clostridium sp.]MCM1172911.1 hypothetical protein [Clostridium sp.]MCM1208599.1 hypothetical protein [Ruminococcus sp.]
MLGKLIKNEFINRGKQVAGIMVTFLGLSCIVAIMGAIREYGNVENDFFYFSYSLLIVVYFIAAYGCVAALLIGAVNDFGKRFFKDQGYLTHTLPVKTSAMMLARMVFDLVLIIAIAIFIPTSICIAARDFDFFVEMADVIRYAVATSDSSMDAATIITELILLCVALLIVSLVIIWTFNVSYAIGHAFNNAKKVMSILAFGLISIVNWTITYIMGYLMFEMDLFYDASPEVRGVISLIFIIAISSVSVAIYAVVTSLICKKKLNLE